MFSFKPKSIVQPLRLPISRRSATDRLVQSVGSHLDILKRGVGDDETKASGFFMSPVAAGCIQESVPSRFIVTLAMARVAAQRTAVPSDHPEFASGQTPP